MNDDTAPLPETETYVMTVPGLFPAREHEIRARWAADMPGKTLIVVDGGVTLGPLASPDQLERLIAMLARIADRLDSNSERDSYSAAIQNWKDNGGRHPDD